MVKPSGVDEIVKLVTLQRVLDETKREVSELKKGLDLKLSDQEGLTMLDREKVEDQDRLEDLTAVTEDLSADLRHSKDELEERRKALRLRRGRLKSAREVLEVKKAELDHEQFAAQDDALVLSSIQTASQTRQQDLITLLSSIFPIDSFTSPTLPLPLLFSILSLPLPNSTYPPSLTDDLISSALGYTAQVVSLLSTYLGVPLHYPVKCLGSRSAVVDLISVMKGPRAFPLYGRGVDRYRFDYGVFLINKNIEQLMYSQGLTVIDLRNTLPNLKSLLLSLSYDPSHSSFETSTLSVPIKFLSPNPNPASEGEEGTSPAESLASLDGTFFRPIPPPTELAEEAGGEGGNEAHSPETIKATIFPSPPRSRSRSRSPSPSNSDSTSSRSSSPSPSPSPLPSPSPSTITTKATMTTTNGHAKYENGNGNGNENGNSTKEKVTSIAKTSPSLTSSLLGKVRLRGNSTGSAKEVGSGNGGEVVVGRELVD